MIGEYLTRWNLDEPEPLATTATSQVFRVRRGGELCVLKLLTEIGARDEAAGALALRHFAGEGAARLLASDERAQLLEHIPGGDLLPLVRAGHDDEATEILCSVLKRLHSRGKPLPRGLVPLERRFQSLLSYQGTADELLAAQGIARELIAHPENETVLHGDLHHENVLLSATRGWLAIDPKGLCGEAAFDAANLVFNPGREPALVRDRARLERQLQHISVCLGLAPPRLRRWCIAFGGLSVLWLREDGLDSSTANAVLRTLLV